MRFLLLSIGFEALCWFTCCHAQLLPAPQNYRQEVPHTWKNEGGATALIIECLPNSRCRYFADGKWYEFQSDAQQIKAGESRWREMAASLRSGPEGFVFPDATGNPLRLAVPWPAVRQVLRLGATNFVAATNGVFVLVSERTRSLGLPENSQLRQLAVGPEGTVYLATDRGLFVWSNDGWQRLRIDDGLGRRWAVSDVLGTTVDSEGRLWFATKAGVGCREQNNWRLYEGKDGVPWNEFTWLAAGPGGDVWFGTSRGVIRFNKGQWQYRQGPAWLPHDNVRQLAVDARGNAWVATDGGLCAIESRQMTLAEKADSFEDEIARYVKRTPYGFVAEAQLRRAGDRSSAAPQDSDNDGLWTAMYGAGECFAYAATGHLKFKEPAQKAFEALRFLQKVTQGGNPEPPLGFVARTIRPIDWPDPNVGRLERDREEQKTDRLWKVYEPRWPKSADGKWFWKSDTSSDELDGHYFFYPLYYEFCTDTEAEKERVRDVVRGITDHLVTHEFQLVDHDGKPTRWGVYGPKYLNRDPDWWQERGLKSLSILSYLAGAAYITGDAKYDRAARDLVENHGYAQNLMHPKVQHGPGSGNQSDDEMAFMCFYSLLRYSKDEELKGMARVSFYRYWINEAPEMNPFFNFCYAAHCLNSFGSTPWGQFPLKPREGWQADAMATLYGFPLDRVNWGHQNSHRLDVLSLPIVSSSDFADPDRPRQRGYRTNGKVLPVENRHFGHWNTDPWRLDYGGNGNELSAGTVFLLPYYMGLYHGFIERPRER